VGGRIFLLEKGKGEKKRREVTPGNRSPLVHKREGKREEFSKPGEGGESPLPPFLYKKEKRLSSPRVDMNSPLSVNP